MPHKTSALMAGLLIGVSMHAAAGDTNPLAAERWKTRPLVLVVPAPGDPVLTAMQTELSRDAMRAGFEEREMVLYTVAAGQGRRGERALSEGETRALLKVLGAGESHGASTYLVGKDGGVKLRERGGVTLERLFVLIDGMPMRRR